MAQIIQKIIATVTRAAMHELKAVPLQPADIKTGFVHCVYSSQTADKVAKFFPETHVTILDIDPTKLGPGLELRPEMNPGGTTIYPHIYGGAIPLEAVIKETGFDS